MLCVRYRFDPENKRALKTIELIVEERPWQPASGRIPMNKKMRIRVQCGEVNLGKQVRAVGGKWNRQKQVWELPYQDVLKLGLTDKITEYSDAKVMDLRCSDRFEFSSSSPF